MNAVEFWIFLAKWVRSIRAENKDFQSFKTIVEASFDQDGHNCSGYVSNVLTSFRGAFQFFDNADELYDKSSRTLFSPLALLDQVAKGQNLPNNGAVYTAQAAPLTERCQKQRFFTPSVEATVDRFSAGAPASGPVQKNDNNLQVPELVEIVAAGDGACLFNALAIGLAYEILSGQVDDHKDKPGYEKLLDAFARHHPNFQPKDWENLKVWLRFYNDQRDIQKIFAPVLFDLHKTYIGEDGLERNILSELLYLVLNNKKAINDGTAWYLFDKEKIIDNRILAASCSTIDSLDFKVKSVIREKLAKKIQDWVIPVVSEFKALLETLAIMGNGYSDTQIRQHRLGTNLAKELMNRATQLAAQVEEFKNIPEVERLEQILIACDSARTQNSQSTFPQLLQSVKFENEFKQLLETLTKKIEPHYGAEEDRFRKQLKENAQDLLTEVVDKVRNNPADFQRGYSLGGAVKKMTDGLLIEPILNNQTPSSEQRILIRLKNEEAHWNVFLNKDYSKHINQAHERLSSITSAQRFNNSYIIPSPSNRSLSRGELDNPTQPEPSNDQDKKRLDIHTKPSPSDLLASGGMLHNDSQPEHGHDETKKCLDADATINLASLTRVDKDDETGFLDDEDESHSNGLPIAIAGALIIAVSIAAILSGFLIPLAVVGLMVGAVFTFDGLSTLTASTELTFDQSANDTITSNGQELCKSRSEMPEQPYSGAPLNQRGQVPCVTTKDTVNPMASTGEALPFESDASSSPMNRQ